MDFLKAFNLTSITTVAIAVVLTCNLTNDHNPPKSYQIPKPDLTPPLKPIQGTIKAKYLNIRNEPSTEGEIVGFLHWYDRCRFLDRVIYEYKDGIEVWYRLKKNPSLWVSGEFVELDGERLSSSTYGDILNSLFPADDFENADGVWRYGNPQSGYKDISYITQYEDQEKDNTYLFAILTTDKCDELLFLGYPSCEVIDRVKLNDRVKNLTTIQNDEKVTSIVLDKYSQSESPGEDRLFETVDKTVYTIEGDELNPVWSGLGFWRFDYFTEGIKHSSMVESNVVGVKDEEVTLKLSFHFENENGISYEIGDGFDVEIDKNNEPNYLIPNNKEISTDKKLELYNIPYGEKMTNFTTDDEYEIICSLPVKIPPSKEGTVWYAVSKGDDVYWGCEE